MQRHNFSAIKQKYRERSCNMEGTVAQNLQVVLFLGERGLAFRGDSQRIGDPNNGNFLGILELIGQYDKILGDHLSKVKESQQSNRRLQVHYLSAEIQNEFIVCCATHVKQAILAQLTATKYYSIIFDATPDSSLRLSYFGMYTAKTRLLTKFKSAFLNLLIVTKKLENL